MAGMAKKRKPDVPKTSQRTGVPVMVYIDPDLFADFERFRKSQRYPPTKTQVIEDGLRKLLAEEGFLTEKPDADK